jgi:hypothetical protein
MRESVAADPESLQHAGRRQPVRMVSSVSRGLTHSGLSETSQARRDVHEECARSYSSCRLAHALRLPGRRRRKSA